MKTLLALAAAMCALLPLQAGAQMRPGHGPVSGGTRFPAVRPIPPIAQPAPPHQGTGGHRRLEGHSRITPSGMFWDSPYNSFFGQPWYWDGLQNSPVVVIAPAAETAVAAPPPPPPPPPMPVRSVMREYDWPETPQQPDGAFSLATKDGAVRQGLAVWVTEGSIHYVSPEGAQGSIPLASIDRETTGRLNAERRLTLSLPVSSN